MNEEQARKRVKELKGYYGHLASYVGVNLGLFALNFAISPGEWWFVLPLFGWGIGLFSHTVSTFGFFGLGSTDWEEEKVQELMGRSASAEELARLGRRIENLTTLVKGRRWAPDRPQTAEAEELLAEVAAGGERPLDKERLQRVIEGLEAVVTTQEFAELERADEGASSVARALQSEE